MKRKIDNNYYVVLIKIILNRFVNEEDIGFNVYNSKYTIVREISEDLYVDFFTKKKYKIGVNIDDRISSEFIDPYFDFICLKDMLKDKSKKEQIDFLNSIKVYLSTLLADNSLANKEINREDIIKNIKEREKIKVKKRGSINEKNI